MKRRIIAAQNPAAIVPVAASLMAEMTTQAIEERGRALLLVSGGASVFGAYEAFGKSKDVDWSRVYIFWGDDRFVEPDNPYSNYKLVHDSLLVNASGLPQANIFPIAFNASTPAECAAKYSATIRSFFGITNGVWPIYDLAQNGMGPDGHTASIFPFSPAALAVDDIAVMNHAGLKPWVDRITLTLPVFNHARNVLFITAGASKTATLKTVFEGSPSVQEMPAAHVNPPDGQLIWLVDRAAADGLTVPVELI